LSSDFCAFSALAKSLVNIKRAASITIGTGASQQLQQMEMKQWKERIRRLSEKGNVDDEV